MVELSLLQLIKGASLKFSLNLAFGNPVQARVFNLRRDVLQSDHKLSEDNLSRSSTMPASSNASGIGNLPLR